MNIPIITFSKLIVSDITSRQFRCTEKEIHIRAAIDWLKLAHDKGAQKGVSYGYSIKGGWRPSYRETTGYIAVTFFNLAKLYEDEGLLKRAFQMCDWELEVQNKDGSISNPHFYPDNGIVFDTGQVLFGLVRAYLETKDNRYLHGAQKAGQWLVDVGDGRHRWTRMTHNGIPHVYNARVAWALLQLNQIDPQDKWLDVACANLDFAVEQQVNGWFDQCAFEQNVAPFTHTIAYAIRGLYESAQILNDATYKETAQNVADSCLEKVESSGFIPGQIDIYGQGNGNYCCLTGNCQLSIIWAKLYRLTGDMKYKDAAVLSLQYVMERQNLGTKNTNIHGAIKGSFPIWGPYSRLTFPNWPTKFFIDAMQECWDWL